MEYPQFSKRVMKLKLEDGVVLLVAPKGKKLSHTLVEYVALCNPKWSDEVKRNVEPPDRMIRLGNNLKI